MKDDDPVLQALQNAINPLKRVASTDKTVEELISKAFRILIEAKNRQQNIVEANQL